MRGNIPILHLFYKHRTGKLVYSRSENNGVSWTVARVFTGGTVHTITNAVAGHRFSQQIFVAYTPGYDLPAMIMKSDDQGATFSTPKNITAHNAFSGATHGLALCESKEFTALSTFFATDDSNIFLPEYALWNPKDMKRTEQEHPFKAPRVGRIGTDCNVDYEKNEVNVAVFLTHEVAGHTYLMFAREYNSLAVIFDHFSK